jgi:TonB family protein
MKLVTLSLGCLLIAGLAGAQPAGAPQSAAPQPATPSATQDALHPGNGVKAPRLLKEVKPNYPASALNSGITGTVVLECVVSTEGACGDIRTVKALDSDALMQEAVSALKQWRFAPGEKDGKPVPVIVTIELSFTKAAATKAPARGPTLDSASVVKPGPGVTLPRIEHEVKAVYPDDAREAGVTGTVQLECVVLEDGTVGDIRISKSLGPSLDAEATRALRQWRFKPGTRDGHPVAIQTTVEMSFDLR